MLDSMIDLFMACLSLLYFPRIIGSHFPGGVYVSQSLNFKSPVYFGEEIIGEVQAVKPRENKKRFMAKFSTKCFNNGEILVLNGEATGLQLSCRL
ncbi:hypothetical protein SLA2020_240070 [Shorea laevis]